MLPRSKFPEAFFMQNGKRPTSKMFNMNATAINLCRQATFEQIRVAARRGFFNQVITLENRQLRKFRWTSLAAYTADISPVPNPQGAHPKIYPSPRN